jgi:hypothetical protein
MAQDLAKRSGQSGTQNAFIWATSSAASCQGPINDHGGHALNAVLFRFGSYVGLMQTKKKKARGSEFE